MSKLECSNAMVLFSGGVDSTTCLGLAIERFGREHVIPVSIFYGQKHAKEIEAAEKILLYYGIKGMELDLTNIFEDSNCSLLSHSTGNIPKESYEEQLKERNGAPVTTYVPFRNGLFLAAAASLALSKKCGVVYYGAHKDDAAGNAYPDCSEAFFQSMNMAVYEGSGHAVKLEAPFISKNKAQVVKEGLRLKVPYELTWSCYEGGERPCGKCGTCIDRQQAFEANGVVDPAM
ncbi:MAG: 7-cyano-7-deazaguanine synthase QueC [Lachnospiraceae bacterium]